MAAESQSTFEEWIVGDTSGESDDSAEPESPYVAAALERRQRARDAVVPSAHPHDATACQNCGTELLAVTRRVMGDNDDIVWRCNHCTPMSELVDGGSADV